MAIRLDHTIVNSGDKRAASTFLAEILGLPAPVPFGPHFMAVRVGEVTFDFCDCDEAMPVGHYAFLVGEDDFDAIFGRIQARGRDYWADPAQQRKGEINRNDGGRGVYFEDPSRHLLEIITRPYGG
ncbi:MAG TPA: VOC family protein [Burkholderiales bacterium]|nr:VOC family protein [Burkholderiales bacterium]